jgi:hypothetical protein
MPAKRTSAAHAKEEHKSVASGTVTCPDERTQVELIFALPLILYIATIIYIVSLLQRIARAVEQIATNTERPGRLERS